MSLRAALAACPGQAVATLGRAAGAQYPGDEGTAGGRVAVQSGAGLELGEAGPVLPHGVGLDGREGPDQVCVEDLAAPGWLEGRGLDAHVDLAGEAGVAVVVRAAESDEVVETGGLGAD